MDGIRKKCRATVPREPLYVVDSPVTRILLMLIVADLLAKIATVMERVLGRVDPLLTFCIELLYVLVYCYFVSFCIYLDNAVAGDPPPWSYTATLNLGFLGEYASEVQTFIASIVVLAVMVLSLV